VQSGVAVAARLFARLLRSASLFTASLERQPVSGGVCPILGVTSNDQIGQQMVRPVYYICRCRRRLPAVHWQDSSIKRRCRA